MIYETHSKQYANYMSFTQLYKSRQKVQPMAARIPQRQGRIRKLVIRKPRKPNSAKRKTAKIYSRRFKFCLAKISGNEYFPIKFASVLITPPGSRDTPNVNWHVLRGKLECLPLYNKTTKKSKYGVRKRIYE